MSDFGWYDLNGTKVRGPFVWLIAERLRQAERNRRAQEESDREYRARMEKQEKEREERRALQAEKNKEALKERAEQEAETARKVAAWRAEQTERLKAEKEAQERAAAELADRKDQEADRAEIRAELDKAAEAGDVEVTPAAKVANWMEADRAYLQAVDDGRPKEEIAALRAGRGEAAQLLEGDEQARAVLTERERERVEAQSFQLDKERRQALERDRGADLGR